MDPAVESLIGHRCVTHLYVQIIYSAERANVHFLSLVLLPTL